MPESIATEIYAPSYFHKRITVEDGEAFETTRQLITREGLLVGTSSGGAVSAARTVPLPQVHKMSFYQQESTDNAHRPSPAGGWDGRAESPSEKRRAMELSPYRDITPRA